MCFNPSSNVARLKLCRLSINLYLHLLNLLPYSSQSKFGYTLFFILVPWPFFIYEFFTSQHYDALVNKVKQVCFCMSKLQSQGASIVEEMSKCSGVVSMVSVLGVPLPMLFPS